MRDIEPANLITIVEDDPDVAKIIEQVLADFGFRTAWCRNGTDLLRRLRTLAPTFASSISACLTWMALKPCNAFAPNPAAGFSS